MNKRMIGILSTLVSGVGLLAMVGGEAAARGVTPLSGMEWVPSERTCFGNGWTRLTNANCNGYKKWLFDAPVDTSNNWHNVNFWGAGDGSTVVKCWAVANDNTGGTGWTVYGDRASTTWGALSMAATQVWIPTGGNLHADCDLPRLGGVSAFHYAP